MKKSPLLSLKTPFRPGGWDIYPRPQMVRDSFFPLGGTWELAVTSGRGEESLGPITMPYVPESPLSGISRTLKKGEAWVYRRRFTLPGDFADGRVLLHFGAVDQYADVSLNGVRLGEHAGGYLPFSFDITDALSDVENLLTVTVRDPLDHDLGWGKQRKKRGGMWYTPTSGIWQTVWCECVPEAHIRAVRITPTLNAVTIEADSGRGALTLTVDTPEGKLSRTFTERITLPIENPRHWSPASPYLYDFTLTDGRDTVRSYFALRTMGIRTIGGRQYLCLNGEPYFFHGLLDQGYYSDGIFLPASPEGYLLDIRAAKDLGFNMLRKHIKLEPEIFYHYCDREGIIVFQDMINSGGYSFLVDTALPTIGMKRGITHRASARRRAMFEAETAGILERLYNHPCVCCYTIFNEGWGQFDADANYRRLKSLDPTRVFDATSGWFHEKESDVQSEHVYFKKLDLAPSARPLVLSEYGGYALKIDGHIANPARAYGYKNIPDADALTSALEGLLLGEVKPMLARGLNAAVLTQLSDVEDEINGLVTCDRRVTKPDAARMRAAAAELYETFENEVKSCQS